MTEADRQDLVSLALAETARLRQLAIQDLESARADQRIATRAILRCDAMKSAAIDREDIALALLAKLERAADALRRGEPPPDDF